ncbi:MAG TPA: AraC family transcriptional regulator [Bacilli bacterium]|nr:AraC family transcriptional regulator [Bacilli bacterium]
MKHLLNDASSYFELSLFECGYEQTIPTKQFTFTPKQYYVVHLVIAGQGVFEASNKRYELKKGDLFFIGPGEHPHYYPDASDPWTYVWLGFGGINAKEYLELANITKNNRITHDDASQSLRYLLEAIYFAYSDSGYLDLHTLGLAYQFFAKLIAINLPHRKTLSPATQHVNRAKVFIYNNYAFQITINDIASNVGVTPNYLSAIFQKTSGISTKQFLNLVRMEAAKKKLEVTTKTITEIAKQVGFNNPLYFSTAFKKQTGLSPEAYRKQEGQNEV